MEEGEALILSLSYDMTAIGYWQAVCATLWVVVKRPKQHIRGDKQRQPRHTIQAIPIL